VKKAGLHHQGCLHRSASRRRRVRDSAVTSPQSSADTSRSCARARLLHIDNRNLEFDGDAVSAQDGCEIHITNSHISATGVGVSARAANVHIETADRRRYGLDRCLDGAQVYAASSRFRA